MRYVTIEMLVAADACHEQQEAFRKHFGTETPITEDICANVAQEFQWRWAGVNLLERFCTLRFMNSYIEIMEISKRQLMDIQLRQHAAWLNRGPSSTVNAEMSARHVAERREHHDKRQVAHALLFATMFHAGPIRFPELADPNSPRILQHREALKLAGIVR